MTQLERIVDAVLEAVNTDRPAGVPATIEWTGERVMTVALPASTLLLGAEVAERLGGPKGPLNRIAVRCNIELLTRNGTAPDVSAQMAAEPLRAWLIKKLEGNRFDGLVLDIAYAGATRQPDQGEVPYARTVVQFDITYTTRVGDAEQRN